MGFDLFRNLLNGIVEMQTVSIGDSECFAQRNAHFEGEFVPFQSDDVDAAEFVGKSSSDSVRGNISCDSAKAADHGVATNPRKLVYGGHSAYDGVVFDNDVSGEHCAIGHDHAVADLAVVGYVAIGHEEAVIADADDRVFLARGVDGDKFPYFTSLADGDIGGLSAKLEILSFGSDACAGPNDSPFADGRIPVDVGVRFDHHIVFENHIFFHHRERLDGDIFSDFCAWFYEGLRVLVKHGNPLYVMAL